MKKMALHWKILIAMAMGIAWSVFSGAYGFNEFTGDWIDPFGKIFINCLKFIAVPLVLFSIITGVAGLGDPSRLGRMGYKTLGLYLITTVSAVSVGLLLANVSQVGTQSNEKIRKENRLRYEIWATDSQIDIVDKRFEMANTDPAKIAEIRAKLSAEAEDIDQGLKDKGAQARANQGQGPLQPLVDMVPDNLIVAIDRKSVV